MDWFQPFTHVKYSVGVIYLVILNLPREERYKLENIIVVGIIPGPKEPKKNINPFLVPLMEDLHTFWNGVSMKASTAGQISSVVVRLAIIRAACDIPALRKLCGFAGHSAAMGCSKCRYQFKSSDWGLDYSGYERQEWEPRTLQHHVNIAHDYVTAETATKQDAIISEHGVRYSVLIHLPYLNVVRHHIIDPMHNLLLGTAKHTIEVWKKKGLLSNKSLETVEERALCIKSPYDVGRLPSKIGSGFSADQWLNWITESVM